jgi:hypothetical protein
VEPGNPVCPKCGGSDLSAGLHERVRALDEVEMLARDTEGVLRREMATRTDGNKEGVIDIDRTGSDVAVRRSGTRTGPMDNLADENSSVAAFADALNRRDGSTYRPQAKEEEDSDVPDVWIVDERQSATNPQRRVGVQVTHLDREAIADLGSRQTYDLSGDVGTIARAAINAIGNKQRVDPAMARKTFLLLIAPYPIRESIQGEIRDHIRAAAPANLYRETWIASLREAPFRVQ